MLGKRAWIPGTDSPKRAPLKSGAFAFSLLPSRPTRLRADNLLLTYGELHSMWTAPPSADVWQEDLSVVRAA
jgi:hypothetical protein